MTGLLTQSELEIIILCSLEELLGVDQQFCKCIPVKYEISLAASALALKLLWLRISFF